MTATLNVLRHAKLVQPIKSRACEDAEYFKVDSTYSKYDMVTSSHMSTDIHDSNVLCYSICVVYITRFVLNGYESKHISDVCVYIYAYIQYIRALFIRVCIFVHHWVDLPCRVSTIRTTRRGLFRTGLPTEAYNFFSDSFSNGILQPSSFYKGCSHW